MKKTNEVKTNAVKTNAVVKTFTIDDLIKKCTEHNLQFITSANNGNYRILRNKSSIFVTKKSCYSFCNDTDFENFKNAKIENVELLENVNAVDKIRKNKIYFTSDNVDDVLKVFAMNEQNLFQNA